jgi:ATP-dependent Clp protease ATP-binding subunit ClpX
LFICGGAFAGLEDIVANRIGKKQVGFGADIRSRKEIRPAEILAAVMPEDLIKFGLIPEFIGRLPVVATVEDLDREQLGRILTEPKNALTRQYSRMLEMDRVELVFEDEALVEIAELAILRGTGARGLRAILEEILLNTMFDMPSRTDIARVVVDAAAVRSKTNPTLIPLLDVAHERSA